MEDREKLLTALRRVEIPDAPRGPVKLDGYGNPIQNVYFRKVERNREGELQNTVIVTIAAVSQFWKYNPEEFLRQPGYSRDVVRAGQDRGIPVIPGVATPTEIQMALADGITLVKFFPAEAIGGIRALSALAGPFPMLRFIPTGGISPDNLDSYLALPSVAAVGGSWMVSPGLVSGRKWTDIRQLAAEAVAAVARHR